MRKVVFILALGTVNISYPDSSGDGRYNSIEVAASDSYQEGADYVFDGSSSMMTAILKDSLNNNRPIHFRAGSYTMNIIQTPLSGEHTIRIYGDGPHNTTITFTQTYDYSIRVIYDFLYISDIRLTNSESGGGKVGIEAQSLMMNNVWIDNFKKGVEIGNAGQSQCCTVTNCQFSGSVMEHGIYLFIGPLFVHGCLFDMSKSGGYSIEVSQYTSYGNKRYGLVTGNYFGLPYRLANSSDSSYYIFKDNYDDSEGEYK